MRVNNLPYKLGLSLPKKIGDQTPAASPSQKSWTRHWEGVLLGANLRRAIVTNGDFMAYVCDSAATRPSSQITLGKLVALLYG